jgi:hypothetical protein
MGKWQVCAVFSCPGISADISQRTEVFTKKAMSKYKKSTDAQ